MKFIDEAKIYVKAWWDRTVNLETIGIADGQREHVGIPIIRVNRCEGQCVLVVDYPPEEAQNFGAAMKANGMDPIFLIAPTSTAERIAQVATIASGYVYYVSLAGVTGSGALNVDAVAEREMACVWPPQNSMKW